MEPGRHYNGFPIRSPLMEAVFTEIHAYARQGYPVMILGPSGVGKEYLAQYYYSVFCEAFRLSKPRFEIINCANLMDELAVGELFGYVKGIFTGAQANRPGLMQEVKEGIIFLDEFGDLTPRVEAILLRAISTDPYQREGRQIGAAESYQLSSNMRIITATEKPRSSIRKSLLFRAGALIFVPGLSKRPEDIPEALRYFFKRAFKSRRDAEEILATLAADQRAQTEYTGEEILQVLTGQASEGLKDLVAAKRWPGNFRSLKAAVDESVMRIVKFEDPISLVELMKSNFTASAAKYTVPLRFNVFISHPQPANSEIFSSSRIFWDEKINTIFPNLGTGEKMKIVEFFMLNGSKSFSRSLFENFIGLYNNKRIPQKRLKKLAEEKVLTVRGKASQIFYTVNKMEEPEQVIRHQGPLARPPSPCVSELYLPHVRQVKDILPNARGIYIRQPPGLIRKDFANCLGHELEKTNRVYFHSFDSEGIEDFWNRLAGEFGILRPGFPDWEMIPAGENWPLKINWLSGYLEKKRVSGSSSVFVLCGIDQLTTKSDQEAVLSLLRLWRVFRFIIIGDKKGNEPELDGFVEYEVNTGR